MPFRIDRLGRTGRTPRKETHVKISLLFAALALLAAPYGHALERVASTPYTGSSTSSAELRLPNCTAGQVLTSLGSNTFTCIDTNATLQSNVNGGEIGLPACGASQALAVSGGKFVCANVVQSSPKCADGYSLQGDDGVSLSCVKTTTSVTCGATEVLTSDQGQFKCVTKADTVPACAAGQFLTGQGGKLACVGITATNCNGRITQNWGGYQYCSSITCSSEQMLSMSDGYPYCANLPNKLERSGGLFMKGVNCDDNACRYANPQTGGCSCPAGYSAFQLWEFATGRGSGFYGACYFHGQVSIWQCVR